MGLTGGVELRVVREIVVTFGEESERGFPKTVSAIHYLTIIIVHHSFPPKEGSIFLDVEPSMRRVVLPSTKSPHHAVHNRNILPLYIVHNNLSDLCVQATIPQEQQVASLKRGFHRS